MKKVIVLLATFALLAASTVTASAQREPSALDAVSPRAIVDDVKDGLMVATVIEIAEDGSARIYVFQRDSQGVARLSMQQVKGIQNIPDWVAKQRARLGVSGTYVFVHIGPDSRVKAEQPVARTLDGKAFRPAYNFFGWGPGALGDRFVSHSFSLREAERDSAFNILKISLTAVGVGRFYLKPLYEVAPAKQ